MVFPRIHPPWAALIFCVAVFSVLVGEDTLLGETDSIQCDPNRPTRILYINSYEPSLKWSQDLISNINATFGNECFHITREHLNGKIHSSDEYLNAITVDVKARYASKESKPDLILVSDDLAYYFLTRSIGNSNLSVRDEIFPNTPVVFCGVNDWKPGQDSKPAGNGYWGVFEQPGAKETLEFIRKAFGDKAPILVLTDTAEKTGPAWLRQIKFAASEIGMTDQIRSLSGDLPMQQLEWALRNEPNNNAVVLLGAYYRDPLISTDTFSETTNRICRAALSHEPPLPVFGLLDLQKGDVENPDEKRRRGIYGGWLITGRGQGEELVKLAKLVLALPKEQRLDFVNQQSPIVWPTPDGGKLSEPRPQFYYQDILEIHRKPIEAAAKGLGLRPQDIGILPPENFWSKIWRPLWVKIAAVLLLKSGLIFLIGLWKPNAVLGLFRLRKNISDNSPSWLSWFAPVGSLIWAVLFTPDFPTKNWLLRRSLQKTASNNLDRATKLFKEQNSLLRKPRVNLPVDQSGEHDLWITSRDELISNIARREQFFVFISGRGGAGKSSLALDIAYAVMKNSDPRSRTLCVVLAAVTEEWLKPDTFLEQLGMFLKNRLNGLASSNGKDLVDSETALAGLRSGQICLVIDGLSEMSAKFKNQFDVLLFRQGRPKKLIVSSRAPSEEFKTLGASCWEIPPLEGPSLLQFIRDFLRCECETAGLNTPTDLRSSSASVAELLAKFVENEEEPWERFLNRAASKIIGAYFSSPWTARSTCLFVILRLIGLLTQVQDESLVALCRVFLSRLTENLDAAVRPNIDDIMSHLSQLSWYVLETNRFRVGRFSLGEAPLREDILKLLIEQLQIIEKDEESRIGSFTCDPIAEFLAAAHMMNMEPARFKVASDKLLAALSELNTARQTFEMRGFVLALLDCQKRGNRKPENSIKIPSEILRALDIRIAEFE